MGRYPCIAAMAIFIGSHLSTIFSCFPSVYFISKKSSVFNVFCDYKAWAENLTGHRIGVLRDDKGGEYIGAAFDAFLRDAGIRREHLIRDTPQQLGVAERMNRSINEGITILLLQSGLAHSWWEDAAMHFLYGKSRIPSSGVKSLTPLELFCKQKPDVSRLRPFGCLAYVHLQKDQCPALAPHASQCILIGYPWDYKGWTFWNPYTRKTFISDSAAFRKSVFLFRRIGLSGVGSPIGLPCPSDGEFRNLISADFAPPPAACELPSLLPPPPLSFVVTPPAAGSDPQPPVHALPPATPVQHPDPLPLRDIAEWPRTPPAVKRLMVRAAWSRTIFIPRMEVAGPKSCVRPQL